MPRPPDLDLVRKREKQCRATMAVNFDHRHAVVEGTLLSADRVWMPDLHTERHPKSTSATIGADRDPGKYRSAQPMDDSSLTATDIGRRDLRVAYHD